MAQLAVVIAPDSFKGSLSAPDVAAAIADGWRQIRPDDHLQMLPQADGGEGTLEAIHAARTDARPHHVDGVTGPDGHPVRGRWLELGSGVGVIEMAQVSGLPMMAKPDPLGATSTGVGELINAVLDHGCTTVIIGLGGSASTDGGAGALAALGLLPLDADGHRLPVGGGSLSRLGSLAGDPRRPEELILLTDVTAPLLGDQGAAAVFGPQKGADSTHIEILEDGLERWSTLLGGPTDRPGMGAAGGIGYGLAQALGGRIVPGAPYVSHLSGLDQAARTADVIISGEGSFDATSLTGKVVGHALGLASDRPATRMVIAGQVTTSVDGVWSQALVDLAGSTEQAISDPRRWLIQAGREAADQMRP